MSFFDNDLIGMGELAMAKLKDFVLDSGWQMDYDFNRYPITFKFTDGQMEIGDTGPNPLQIIFIFGAETQ